MKTADIREAMTAYLLKLGFARGAFAWQPGKLLIHVGAEFKIIKLPSGTSRRNLAFEMGRLSVFAEIAGIKPPSRRKANGIHAAPVTGAQAG